MTWKELLEKSGGKPFVIFKPVWKETYIYTPNSQDHIVLAESSLTLSTIAIPISYFDCTAIDPACVIDWFEDEDEMRPDMPFVCVCDFRGANCWLGCRCRFPETKL